MAEQFPLKEKVGGSNPPRLTVEFQIRIQEMVGGGITNSLQE